jgi:RimJ/RimL family protein N-acetyltransferase
VITLQHPTLEQCELVRQWRNAPDVLPMLRTREPLTVEQQAAFYRDVVSNPASNHRYYALMHQDQFVGLGGLTYLDRVPGEGEISLILGPEFRRGGIGSGAVQALRVEGGRLGLRWIVGECYDTNPAQWFWVKAVVRCDGSTRFEPDRMFFRISAVKL